MLDLTALAEGLSDLLSRLPSDAYASVSATWTSGDGGTLNLTLSSTPVEGDDEHDAWPPNELARGPEES